MSETTTCPKTCPVRRKFLSDCVKHAAAAALLPAVGRAMAGCGGEDKSTGGSGSAGGTSGATAGSTGQGTTGGTTPSGTTSGSGSTSTVTRFTFTQYPALKNPGGSILLDSQDPPLAVVRLTASTAVVLNATCPHQGCTVEPYDSGAQTFTCPCHSSVYDSQGNLKRGPATRGLTTYAATVSDTDISATIT